MPQDSFHIRRLAEELNRILCGGKVNRVSQPNKDEITLIIYTEKGVLKLVLNTNASFARVCVQNEETPPLLVPPPFCMLLRKHLSGAQILSVKQVENERILALTFLCFNDFSGGEKVLYAELMGKYSNLILTENGVICGALKSAALENSSGRALFAGAKYGLPAPQEKVSPVDKEAVFEKWRTFLQTIAAPLPENEGSIVKNNYAFLNAVYGEEAARFLFLNVAGIAASTALHIARKAKQRGVLPENFPDFFVGFFKNEPVVPCLIEENGQITDFFAFLPCNEENVVIKPAHSLNEAEAVYYVSRSENRAFNEKKARLSAVTGAKIKKNEKNLADIYRRLQEAENAEANRVKGELITANLYKIQKGDAFLTAENWYEGGKEEKILLDKTLSPARNAQKYFKTYAKEKRTKAALLPRREEEERELSYFRSVLSSIQSAENADDLKETEEELRVLNLLPQEKARKKKAEVAVPFRKYVIEGFSVLAGRNNVSNDRLTHSLGADDIWLHTQKYHSAHVGILTEGKAVPQNVLLAAAEICAYFSEAKNGEKIAVDYAQKKYVKKPKKAAPGFVVYTDYKTLYVAPAAHESERNA
ncbi:MAG: NFACT RNA binding domain-containing protein [Candidatus Borkfalkiaceae bacterium]|nr:NFACT RNA binding domain-containing protein [Clostridia bacterium]MDY6224083.1 NFACT RNA binding domain-containing protein [Christensenellaceae bacterium]